ncbi:MAG: ferredoxin [Planctomycetota bacterium]
MTPVNPPSNPSVAEACAAAEHADSSRVIFSRSGPEGEPLLPPKEVGGPVDPTAVLRSLRHFHLACPEHRLDPREAALEIPGEQFLPALLAPFRDLARVRSTYPLFLDPPGKGPDGRVSVALGDWLAALVTSFAPGGDQARVLKDNLKRIERSVRQALAGRREPADARELLGQASEALKKELQLTGENAARLEADLETLLSAAPEGGRLLGYSDDATLYLQAAVLANGLPPARAAFREELKKLCRKLQTLLQVERTKDPEALAAEGLRSTMGPALEKLMDPAKLASLAGATGGTLAMGSERRERIEGLLKKLLDHTASKDHALFILVSDTPLPAAFAQLPGVRTIRHEDPCTAAAALFDAEAARMGEVFKAAHIARLEIDDAYDPKRHAVWLERFGWEAFSEEELSLVPPVVVLAPAAKLASLQMVSLSRLLLSGRPVKVIVVVEPAANPAFPGDPLTDSAKHAVDPAAGFRLELSYWGISHREALVHQSSPARPEHLTHGFQRAASSARPALHVIASSEALSGTPSPVGAWLHSGAALESRAHPFFLYDPEAGETWARRFSFDGNPQAEVDWPTYTMPCRAPEGGEQELSLAFTFADFALLEPICRSHFCVVPPGCSDEDLIPMATYLELPRDQAIRRIPHIWAVDGERRLHRLVVSRRLAFACRDRLDYWHTLRELAGIHNEYVEQAAQKVRAEIESAADARIAELEARHAAELETARREAAGEAMQRLAATLLATDFTTLLPGAPKAGAPAPAGATATLSTAAPAQAAEGPAATAPPAQAAAEEAVTFDEPWIDSALCTTCNDCINLNAQLFVYNANKQAVIGNARAGTFAQLVQAAEKCPAHCIHPGKPLNANEPNLEELIKRAAKFN